MTTFGITGHQNIPASGVPEITDRLRQTLREHPNCTMATSLAAGADQLAAALTLEVGGQLHVVVPSANYRDTFESNDLRRFDNLLAAAATVEELPHPAPSEEAFYRAGLRVLELADVLLAVWDGQPAKGHGGTADIVLSAKVAGKTVRVIWPEGLTRQ